MSTPIQIPESSWSLFEEKPNVLKKLRHMTADVQACVANGGVPNPLFKDWKFSLNRRVDGLGLETATGYLMYINHYKAAVKNHGEDHPKLVALKPWYDLYMQAKENVVKMRRGTGESKPKYEAPLARSETVKKVHELLTKLTEEAHKHLKASYIDYMLSGLERYLKDRLSQREPLWKYYHRTGHQTDHFSCLLGHRLADENQPKPKEEQEKICDGAGQHYADAVCDQFIHKNLTKLCSVVEGKTLVKSSYNFRGSRSAIEGTMTLVFDDGKQFDVRNQIVTVWSYGYHHTVFNRFPTTFHNVKFADGTVKKMVPEKQMNEVWKVS